MKYNRICILGVLLLSLPASDRADTLRLTRNVDINGTVNYVDGTFTIHSRFSGRDEPMIIGREYVTEVRFNTVVDNPGSPEGWMKQLQHNPARSIAGADTIKTTDDKELHEKVVAITSTELVTDKEHHARTTVRAWVLPQE